MDIREARIFASELQSALHEMGKFADAMQEGVTLTPQEHMDFAKAETRALKAFAKLAGIMDPQNLRSDVGTLADALLDATAHLSAAASAYERYASRHRSVGRAVSDPFYTTRVVDFKKAADRARAATRIAFSRESPDGNEKT